MAVWILKTWTRVSHCSMSKERINWVNDCTCSDLFGVDEDTSLSAIWSLDLFTGPKNDHEVLNDRRPFHSFEKTHVKQVIDSHPKTIPPCLPERSNKKGIRRLFVVVVLTRIKNETWKIFSTERENSVGWIVKRKKLIGCSTKAANDDSKAKTLDLRWLAW